MFLFKFLARWIRRTDGNSTLFLKHFAFWVYFDNVFKHHIHICSFLISCAINVFAYVGLHRLNIVHNLLFFIISNHNYFSLWGFFVTSNGLTSDYYIWHSKLKMVVFFHVAENLTVVFLLCSHSINLLRKVFPFFYKSIDCIGCSNNPWISI